MQKAIMFDDVNITAGHLYKSHLGSCAIDLNNKTILKAFCDCKVVKVYDVKPRGTCSVWFESIDPVITPNGVHHITWRCAHMNYDDYHNLAIKIGRKFAQGEVCYFAGLGGTKAKHIHIEVGLGKLKGSGWTRTGNVAFGLPVMKIATEECETPIYSAIFLNSNVKVTTSDEYQKKYTWKYVEEISMEYELVDPNLTLHVLGTNKSYDTYSKPRGTVIGRINSDEYLKVHKITKNLIAGYKYALVDTYTQYGVYVKVDLNVMRFEI